MRKITKSLLTALSLTTSVVSLAPAASAGVASAAVKTTKSIEYHDGTYAVSAEFYDVGSNVNSTEASLLPTMMNVVIKNGKLTTLSFSLDKDSAVYSDLTLNGKKAKTTTDKNGKVTYTFTGAYKAGKGSASFVVSSLGTDAFKADMVLGALPSKSYTNITTTNAVAKKKVQRNSAVYNSKAVRIKGVKTIKAGKTITTYGTLTRGTTKFYKISKKASQYIRASNVDGKYITLKVGTLVYDKNAKATKEGYKPGKKLYAYEKVTLAGSKFYRIGTNRYVRAVNADGKYITLKHSSIAYTKDLQKTTVSYAEGKKLYALASATLNNKKYYQVGTNAFVIAANADGTQRTLKKNAYVYKKSKGKAVRSGKTTWKKNSKHKTYGSAVTIKGKKYYIVAVGKYVVKSNFR